MDYYNVFKLTSILFNWYVIINPINKVEQGQIATICYMRYSWALTFT